MKAAVKDTITTCLELVALVLSAGGAGLVAGAGVMAWLGSGALALGFALLTAAVVVQVAAAVMQR